jgi:hypothetical protein
MTEHNQIPQEEEYCTINRPETECPCFRFSYGEGYCQMFRHSNGDLTTLTKIVNKPHWLRLPACLKARPRIVCENA